MVLVPVQDGHIDLLFIRTPRHIGEVLFSGTFSFDLNAAATFYVIYVKCNVMAFAPRHGIFDVFVLSRVSRPVYDWIVGHICLVHAVVSKRVPARTPESSFVNAELV